MAYRRKSEKVLTQGDPAVRKQLLRAWIKDIKISPETREVEISCQLPEPVMDRVIAGAGVEPATLGL